MRGRLCYSMAYATFQVLQKRGEGGVSIGRRISSWLRDVLLVGNKGARSRVQERVQVQPQLREQVPRTGQPASKELGN